MMLLSTESIILRNRRFGDSSKIAVAYTKLAGKINVLAKGAFNAKSRFVSALEPLSISLLNYYDKPNRDLHLLSAAETIIPTNKISTSFEHLTSGLMILESVEKTQDEGLPNDELYELIAGSISRLSELCCNPFSVFSAMQLRLAEAIGFGFDFNFDEDLLLMIRDSDKILFSLESATVANEAEQGKNSYIQLDRETFEFLYTLSNTDAARWSDIPSTDIIKAGTKSLFEHYFSYHLEKKFNYKYYDLFAEKQ